MASGNKSVVGIVGLGIMGGAFAENLVAGGWRVIGYDISAARRKALARAGVEIEVLANEVDFAETGWTMSFVDPSDNGHDKAAHVRAARAGGAHTVYVGDGISDFEAALAADERFAKKGRALEAFCRARGVACESFDSFSQIERQLFP